MKVNAVIMILMKYNGYFVVKRMKQNISQSLCYSNLQSIQIIKKTFFNTNNILNFNLFCNRRIFNYSVCFGCLYSWDDLVFS